MRIHKPPRPHSPWPMVASATVAAGLLAAACCLLPRTRRQPMAAVLNFDADRYTGHWYELARTDNRFEKGLTQATAYYLRNRDGSLRVINRGYDAERKRWKQIEGKAKFAGAPDVGALKVTFFEPFHAAYNIVALDEDYQWALVLGSDPSYMWILSRTPTLSPLVRERLAAHAQALGVNMADVLWRDSAG